MVPEEDSPRGEVQEPLEVPFSRHYVEWGDYEDEVVVAVITGTREGMNGCTEEAVLGAIDVELDDPVGHHEVVDPSQRSR